ncbi:MAG: cobalamin biosynthesis protein CobD [Rhodospirillaceae bacterium]|nr:cobalamin biosynthesis protein CobD [Rhodospirillaceae bacterium]
MTVLAAYGLDWLLGDPKWLYRRISHPIAWIGGLITALEFRLRNPKAEQAQQIKRGAVLAVIVVSLAVVIGNAIVWLAPMTGYGWIIVAVIGAVFIAARGLHDHVIAVARALDQGVGQGRDAVSQIVGRDASDLDEGGISRAAIESLAENFSDGVVAPLFWFLLCGLPGLLAYKAINTMDSMVGHRSERYLYFGRFAAYLDDVANWPAARITAVLLCLGALILPGMEGRAAWRMMWRDHGVQPSPNAGWPEAAMAGALGIALAGPRVYHGEALDGPWMGDGRRAATRSDILRGSRLYRLCCVVIGLLLAVAAFV